MFPSLFKNASMRPTSSFARAVRSGLQTRGKASVVTGTERAAPLKNVRSTKPSFERATFTIRVSQNSSLLTDCQLELPKLTPHCRTVQSTTERVLVPGPTFLVKLV